MNTTLQQLDVSGNDGVDSSTLTLIANALENNRVEDAPVTVELVLVEDPPVLPTKLDGPRLLPAESNVLLRDLGALEVARVAAELLSPPDSEPGDTLPQPLHSLTLTRCTFDFVSAKALCAALIGAGACAPPSVLTINDPSWRAGDFAILVAAIEKNAPLIALHLHNPRLASAQTLAEPLALALRANTSLCHLDLEQCALDAAAVETLTTGLSATSALISLSLANNPEIGDGGMQALSDALAAVPALQTMDLSNSGMGDAGMELFAPMLARAPALTTLRLRSNGIADIGATAVGAALQPQSSLTLLDLERNDVGGTGARALAAALLTCQLRILDLRRNECGDTGASAIASSLESRECPLETLILDSNSIGVAGATSLATALLKNSRLTLCSLRFNGKVGSAGAASLAAALLRNSTLRRLDVGGCKVEATGAASLAAALEKGSTGLTRSRLGCDLNPPPPPREPQCALPPTCLLLASHMT